MPVARPHRAGHLLGLRLPGGAPADLAARLAAARVFVSVRGDAVRVSPHVYNDQADVDRLLEVLADAVGGREPPGPSCSIPAWIGATCCERPRRSSSS